LSIVYRLMNTSFLGELAALGAATMWSLSSLFFTTGSRRIGSMVVNRVRLALAVLFVGTAHLLLFGTPFPAGAEPYRILWLALSGVIGLVIGDSLLFQSYVLIGPRLGVLMLSLAPIFSTLLAWTLLGERLSVTEMAAIAVALGGVAWVVLEHGRGGEAHPLSRASYVRGILFGAGAGFCQAAGLVTAKRGLAGDFPALSGVMVRMTVAMTVMWLLAAFRREIRQTIRAPLSDRIAARAVLGGTLLGPFVGVWLSLIAVQSARVAIASTLMAMTPVISLPVVHWFYHERVSRRAVAGTLIAMAGVAAMFLV
jgi:drug/metabolite transporter (DMT)-like permease